MAGIDLRPFSDSFLPNVGNAGGSLSGAPSAVLSSLIPGGNFLQAGLQAFSMLAQPDTSGAAGATNGNLNTSGWVVGKGDAEGGALTQSSGLNLPWYGWAALTVAAVLMLRGKK